MNQRHPLAAALSPRDADGPGPPVAIIDNLAPLTITIRGQSGVPASRLSTYTPVVGHRVLVTQDGASYLVHARIIPGE